MRRAAGSRGRYRGPVPPGRGDGAGAGGPEGEPSVGDAPCVPPVMPLPRPSPDAPSSVRPLPGLQDGGGVGPDRAVGSRVLVCARESGSRPGRRGSATINVTVGGRDGRGCAHLPGPSFHW